MKIRCKLSKRQIFATIIIFCMATVGTTIPVVYAMDTIADLEEELDTTTMELWATDRELNETKIVLNETKTTLGNKWESLNLTEINLSYTRGQLVNAKSELDAKSGQLVYALQKIRRLEEEIEFTSPPIITGNITFYDLQDILYAEFGYNITIHQQDSTYNLTTKSEIRRFLDRDKTNNFNYVVDDYDCDDFALRLRGMFAIPNGWSSLPIGLIEVETPTNRHFCLMFVDDFKQLWIINYGEILEKPDSWTIMFVII